jgi:hypothetical protein
MYINHCPAIRPFSSRKRILRAMTNGDITPGENIVDEAADVERRLAHIRDLIILAEAKEAVRDTDGSQESQVTQEEKVDAEGDGNGLSEVLIYLFGVYVMGEKIENASNTFCLWKHHVNLLLQSFRFRRKPGSSSV